MNRNYYHMLILLNITIYLGACFEIPQGSKDLKKKSTFKTIKYNEYVPVENEYLNSFPDLRQLTASEDGKHVYLRAANNVALFYCPAQDLETGCTQLSLSPNLSGTIGQAKLLNARRIINISAASDGALVSVSGSNKNSTGAFYLKGNKYEAAWGVNQPDMNAQNGAREDQLTLNQYVVGIVVKKDGIDVPYFWGKNRTPPASATILPPKWIAMTRENMAAGRAGRVLQGNNNPTPQFPAKLTKDEVSQLPEDKREAALEKAEEGMAAPPFLISGSNWLFAVFREGVTALPKDKIGVSAEFPRVSPDDGANIDGTMGSKQAFMMEGTTKIENSPPTAVMWAGNNLFIGFRGTESAKQGGVAVYHVGDGTSLPTISRPDAGWDGISVKYLIKDNENRVWAVAYHEIIEALPNGKKGRSYFSSLPVVDDDSLETAAPGSYRKGSLPNRIREDHIDSAVFLGDQLVVLSDTLGLLFVKEKEKTFKVKKVKP